MSRRAAIVEEFDDDTDLPLPSMPLPNTGSRGPLLQELHIDDDQFNFNQSQSSRAGPASPPRQGAIQDSASSGTQEGDSVNRVTDITPYKTWTCIYPIYLDAKRPYASGQRRVARAKGLWWPLSKDIADAASRLGLGTLHEVNKSHPRDWENPGRVRVQWKKDGKLLNPVVNSKKQLLEMICFQLQHLKPENIPKPPYNMSSLSPSSTAAPTSTTTTTTASSSINTKGKQPVSKSKPASGVLSQTHNTTSRPAHRPLPSPPTPLPPLNTRVSGYSPAIATGVLIETVKAGMAGAAAEGAAGGAGASPGGPAAGGMAGKGKRKVVRVRG
ncbi:hypothetical protein M413DRAFT_444738 [Hebeloma cylindrosporum]|uniref:Signal recognition particle SRP19 subunit n=1 Tax=Hebeloma cylindrosporum TaxID=76867 RepID=A0A0C3CFB4_HEBCY|nr:hypothetical protein M413DRAFT_444738 [Hebeloma cylindrosporum h7]